jgi:aminoglycoside phosphotransferase (APT) family kinase protein
VNKVGPGARVVDVQALHDWGPWWLRIEYDGSIRNAVLRLGDRHSPQLAANAAALRFAAENSVAAPRLLASELHGETLGFAASLETALPGNSALPPTVTPARLREAGAAIAKVHAVRLDPRPDLPLRVRPTQVDDRAMERRWATLFQAATESERDAVIAALCELTGWTPKHARGVVSAPHSTPLLQLADERIREIDRPHGETVFLHGDVWTGNMRWEGDTCTALIDWFCAGAGDPGVDLGELRMQMGYQYGLHAAGHVLDGWQHEAGREATDVAYWDTVAALNTPVDMAGWPAFDSHGNALDQQAVIDRRDAFLRSALDRLPP